MKKTMPILAIFVGGVLILSGFGVATGITKQTTLDNHPPEKPEIDGPLIVSPGTHEWTFRAIDPDGDNLSYQIDWDKGEFDDWFGPFKSGENITRNHTYPIYDIVIIKARAKDIHGAIGGWGYIKIEIPKSKHIINPIFLQFIKQFLMLE